MMSPTPMMVGTAHGQIGQGRFAPRVGHDDDGPHEGDSQRGETRLEDDDDAEEEGRGELGDGCGEH